MLDLAVDIACHGAFIPIAYVEIEAFAASILATRMAQGFLPSAPVWSDLRTVCDDEFSAYVCARTGGQGIDFLYGGFPCQPHSTAGKQLREKDPRDLWPEIVRIIERYRPGMCFFENVPGILPYLSKRIVPDLHRLGYRLPRPVLLALH